MNRRHAAALALWTSRVFAAILLALPFAFFEHRLDVRALNAISSDPQAFLLHEQHLHSHPFTQHLKFLFLFGLAYIIAIELLGWGIRKGASYARTRFGFGPQSNQDIRQSNLGQSA